MLAEKALPEVPELAVICTPPATVAGLIAELGEAGAGAGVGHAHVAAVEPRHQALGEAQHPALAARAAVRAAVGDRGERRADLGAARADQRAAVAEIEHAQIVEHGTPSRPRSWPSISMPSMR